MLEQIRFGEQGNNINRIVIDLKEKADYTIAQSEDETKIYIAFSSGFVVPDKNEQINVPNEDETLNNSDEENNGETNTPDSENNGENIIPGDENISDIPNEEKPDEQHPDNGNGENIDVPNEEIEIGEENNVDDVVEYKNTITGLKYSASSDTIKIIYEGAMLDYTMKE